MTPSSKPPNDGFFTVVCCFKTVTYGFGRKRVARGPFCGWQKPLETEAAMDGRPGTLPIRPMIVGYPKRDACCVACWIIMQSRFFV